MLCLLLTLPAWGRSQERTVEQVLSSYGPDARARLAPFFDVLPDHFEPVAIKLVAIKADRRLEVWLQDVSGGWSELRSYPILEASGSLRPKMRQGDFLVPEGVYRIEAANPNSQYHLSLKIDYPNAMDRHYGALEQRGDLGGDIFIHGRDVSQGCLAMGDRYIEELFVLAHDIGLDNIEVVITPRDPRHDELTLPFGLPNWVAQKYDEIEVSLAQLSPAFPQPQDNVEAELAQKETVQLQP
ncbi:L,D-transpeptidase family protein [Marinobacter hydrocarbonoclasticus]|nr:L,D-transpeptidase family protein [Marinobacter nauticus]